MNNFLKIGVIIGLSIVVAMSSCNRIQKTDNHSHEEGEQMTVYSNNFELFAEIKPLQVGENGTVLAHLTHLNNYKPLDSTKVTMVLKINESEQREVIEYPKYAGIYKFEFVPKMAGCGTVRIEIAMGDSVECLCLDSVRVFANHDELHEYEMNHGHSKRGVDKSNTVVFLKEQSWKVDFATEVTKNQCFGRVIKTAAQVLPSQGDEREVSAKASGIVVFNNPNLVEGAKVSAGQKLFSIESSGMAENNMGVKFREASATYSLAKEEYERKQKLAKDKIVTESELQRAKMELETAQAVYDNLKNNFSTHGEFVSSPLTGYVQNIAVRNGAYVDAGQQIMTVSQNRDLFVRADVQPRYYQDLNHIVGANMQLMNSDKVYDLSELDGGLVSYGKSTDVDNPLIPVTFKFRNTVDVLSGGFVTLYIRTMDEEEVITIPNTGIVEIMGVCFVFVQLNPELFEKRAVELGATDGIRTIIKSGLKEGERVVSKGAIMVKLAQASATLDPHAGHVH